MTDPKPQRPCAFCVNMGEYCYGCQSYICGDCDVNYDMPSGGHMLEDHEIDPEEDEKG